MIKLFISHAGPDAELANRLYDDLKTHGHDVIVDTHDFAAGSGLLEFMNDSIESADYRLILVSPATEHARFQRAEKDASIVRDITRNENRTTIIRVKDANLGPLESAKRYIPLANPADESQYNRCLQEIVNMIERNQNRSSVTKIVAAAFKIERHNPFKRIRAEYFDDSSDLMKVFAAPDPVRAAALEEQPPCFLEGPRGTGKSMLLLSLRARNYFQKHADLPPQEKYRVFGIYLKLAPGVLSNTGDTEPNDVDSSSQSLSVSLDLALQEIILCLAECLIGELSCIHDKCLIEFSQTIENALSMDLSKIIFGPREPRAARTFSELHEMITNLRDKFSEYIRRKLIYGENASIPVAHLSLNSLGRMFSRTKNHLPQLSESTMMILLDEYENLSLHQQCIVNTIVKFGAPHYSVKVAKKIGIKDNSSTISGQELQEIHDYRRIVLVYDLGDSAQRSLYYNLLKQIVENIMVTSSINFNDISTLLPSGNDPQLPLQDVQRHLDKLSERKNGGDAAGSSQCPSYYRLAAIYRALHDHGRRREFSGFNDLAFISSGVIRYFQEILGVAYHLAVGDQSPDQSTHLTLSPAKQSDAVHIISEHTLTTLSKNLQAHGETLKFLLLDLGACLRRKLLEHTSEPEAGRLTIKNAEVLRQPEFAHLLDVLNLGVREGMFQTKEGRPAFRPRHASDPQGVEFNVSRVLAPVLEISPRLRWRTCVDAKLLLGLIGSHDSRKDSLVMLLRSIVKSKTLDLSESDQLEQRVLFGSP